MSATPLYYQKQLEDNRTPAGAPKVRSWKEAQREQFRSTGNERLQTAGNKGGGRKSPTMTELGRERHGMISKPGSKMAGPGPRGADALPKMRTAINDALPRESAADPEAPGPVKLDASRYMAQRLARSTRRVLSVLSFAGWTEEELQRVRRCLGRWPCLPQGRAAQRDFYIQFGFAAEDAGRLAG